MLRKFLLLDETSGEAKTKTKFKLPRVLLRNSHTNECLPRHVTLNLSEKKLYVLAGPTGSGKSSFLKALMHKLISSVDKEVRSVSYASQEAWLFPDSVRENILFYQPFNEARYRRVVEVCALMPDILELPNQDLTLVGDRGANLSGGQRARINLARAIYKEADMYLIDDVLASVDVHVNKRIMYECINGYLKEKIRILVSHNPEHHQEADEIIVMKDGKIDFHGSYANLTMSDYRLPKWHPVESTAEDPPPVETERDSAQSELELPRTEPDNASETDGLVSNPEDDDFTCCKYFSAGGSFYTLLCLGLSFILAQASVSGCDYWLAKWMMENKHTDKDIDTSLRMKSGLCLFGGLTLSSIVMWTASSILFYKVCMNASKNLHNEMFSSLLKTSMRFFQLNSTGRILNRFSKDMGLVDETLPTLTLDAVQGLLMTLGVVVQLFFSIGLLTGVMLIPSIMSIWASVKLTDTYLLTARGVKRNECKAKSAVFSHTQSTISGLTTIRSAKNQQPIRNKFDSLQSDHLSLSFRSTIWSSAYGFIIDVLSAILLIAVCVLCLRSDGTGMEALAITQVLMLYGKIQYSLRQSAEMMVQMVSVERIFQLIDLKSEGCFETEETALKEWPFTGKIEFSNVYLKYFNDEEPVLKNISFTINHREKIGIVGRTGAGKTSLIAALLRLAETDGSICIDDIDIQTVGLHDLRRRISIIPQEPLLFSTTVRNNLDPLHIYSDEILWKALEDVQLVDRFDNLDCQVENGENCLSVGQKQLLCLARALAIVARNKIVILDEATSNIDPVTEQIIHKIIQSKFSECTLITIAHRLNNIFSNDKILVLDQGRIIEFDSPSTLMQRKDGYFFKMVNA